MIDIHCHLLPGIDDGPPSPEAALALAKALVEDGVTRAIVTPHVFPGRYDNDSANIAEAHARFVALLAAEQVPLTVDWAGEVRLTPEVLDMLPRNNLPFLGESGGYKTLLLELPDGQVPMGTMNFIGRLLAARVRPVIAHPERNRGVMERPDRLQEFIEEGCYLQVTAGSLVGQFGTKAQATAVELLRRGWVHAVASDAHNLSGRRPRMRDAAAWLVQHHGAVVARELTVLGPSGLCMHNQAANGHSLSSIGPGSGA